MNYPINNYPNGNDSRRMAPVAVAVLMAVLAGCAPLPPKDAAHTAEVRIFTPRAEMPFAGHPNIGTAFVLARVGTSYGRAVPQDRARPGQ